MRAQTIARPSAVVVLSGWTRSLSLRSESDEMVLRQGRPEVQGRPEETAGMTAIDRHEQPRAADQDYVTLFPVLWQKAYVVAYRVLGSRAGAEDVVESQIVV